MLKKRIVPLFCAFALGVGFMPNTGVSASFAIGVNVDFSDASMKTLESIGEITVGDNATGGIVKGEQSRSGDEAFKVTHKDGTDYMSMPNGIQLTFKNPLPANTVYRITAHFYVPEEGNSGKGALIGPGILVNGNAGSNEYKYPTNADEAGTIKFGEWKQATFETPAYDDEIEFITFRFYTNDEPTHPNVYYIDDISIISDEVVVSTENKEVQTYLTPLKDIYSDYFLIGTASGEMGLKGKNFELMKQHFNTLTFENEMKPENVQRTEGTFNFNSVDNMTKILKENNFNIVGHTLAWHSQTPGWMYGDKDKDLAKARLEAHVEAVIRHSGADLISIDVVNEAFTNDGAMGKWQDGLRKDEGWYTALGADFIEIAFRKAGEVRAAIGRPDLKLYYNDFNLDNQNKAQNVYLMVKELKEAGVPIDGIGMQAHYAEWTNPENVRASIELFNKLDGIEVSITELDVTIGSSQGKENMNEQQARQQAGIYSSLMQIYKEYAKGPANTNENKRLIARVSFWGLTDNQSWRSDRFPLLFDKNYQAKAAYYAVAYPGDYESQIAKLTYWDGTSQEETPTTEAAETTEPAATTEAAIVQNDGNEPVQTDAAPASNTQNDTPSGSMSTLLLVLGGLAIVTAVVAIIFKRKK